VNGIELVCIGFINQWLAKLWMGVFHQRIWLGSSFTNPWFIAIGTMEIDHQGDQELVVSCRGEPAPHPRWQASHAHALHSPHRGAGNGHTGDDRLGAV